MQFSSNRFQKRKVNSGAWSFLNFLTAWSLCRDDSSRIRNLMRYLRLYQDAKRPEWNPDFMNKIEKKIKHCPPTHSNILILLTLIRCFKFQVRIIIHEEVLETAIEMVTDVYHSLLHYFSHRSNLYYLLVFMFYLRGCFSRVWMEGFLPLVC